MKNWQNVRREKGGHQISFETGLEGTVADYQPALFHLKFIAFEYITYKKDVYSYSARQSNNNILYSLVYLQTDTEHAERIH